MRRVPPAHVPEAPGVVSITVDRPWLHGVVASADGRPDDVRRPRPARQHGHRGRARCDRRSCSPTSRSSCRPARTSASRSSCRRASSRLACPGGEQVRSPISVTGKPPTPAKPASAAAVARYRTWVEGQSQQLVNATMAFTAALDRGNVARAQALYPTARIYYERVEPIAESFSTLDKQIDSRAGDVPAASWTGFHPIEQRLWIAGHHQRHGTAEPEARRRRRGGEQRRDSPHAHSVPDRERRSDPARRGRRVQDHGRGRALLAHRSRRLRGQPRGIEAAFEAVRPLLPAHDKALGATIQARFARVRKALDAYRSGSGFRELHHARHERHAHAQPGARRAGGAALAGQRARPARVVATSDGAGARALRPPRSPCDERRRNLTGRATSPTSPRPTAQ